MEQHYLYLRESVAQTPMWLPEDRRCTIVVVPLLRYLRHGSGHLKVAFKSFMFCDKCFVNVVSCKERNMIVSFWCYNFDDQLQ